ncbi:mdn1 [Symbiodinium sp. CCMP2456]|nr:mdn1 [Symbiodinium sp. CCMP2456]
MRRRRKLSGADGGGKRGLQVESSNALKSLVLDATDNEQADLSGVNWDAPADAVRCRHGVRFKVVNPDVSQRLPFVSTAPASQAMRQLLLAIGTGSPVLVGGPSGVGKTAFVRRAAELMGQLEPVFLFCDEQTDIKMLLGAYVCGETVGEFVWRPGVVTEALQKGRWLVLEDVDRVPSEVLAALLPLSDSRRLVIPDRNQCLSAHEDFRLFGTLSCGSEPVRWSSHATKDGVQEEATVAAEEGQNGGEDEEDESDTLLAGDPGARGRVPALVSAWARVWLAPLQELHLAEVITGLFPELEPIQGQLLDSASALRLATEEAGPRAMLGGLPATGPRDLLRWCSRLRLAKLVLSPSFTEESRTALLREALQVILGRVADLRLRRAFLSCLAPIWSLSSGIAEALLQERPTVTLLPSSAPEKVQIGSITLPLAVQGEDPAVRCAPFAYTSVHARILQALASAIRADEPALLVGDTGTGKTSVVQHIGRLLGQEVLVYNFNEQSESTELIGGFRPVDNVMQLMSELVELFCSTFEKSFSRRKNARLLEKARGDFLGRRWASVLHSIGSVMSKAQQSLSDPVTQASKGVKGTHLAAEWEMVKDLHRKASAVVAAGSAPRFEFKEGLLVQVLQDYVSCLHPCAGKDSYWRSRTSELRTSFPEAPILLLMLARRSAACIVVILVSWHSFLAFVTGSLAREAVNRVARFARGFGNEGRPAAKTDEQQVKTKKGLRTTKAAIQFFEKAKGYREGGDNVKAVQMYRKARVAIGKAAGKGSKDYARVCSDLATAYLDLDQQDRAADLYEESRRAFESSVGTAHAEYAGCLRNLARLRRALGNIAEAETLLKEASHIYAGDLGSFHEEYALTLRSLATLYQEQGQMELLQPILLEEQRVRPPPAEAEGEVSTKGDDSEVPWGCGAGCHRKKHLCRELDKLQGRRRENERERPLRVQYRSLQSLPFLCFLSGVWMLEELPPGIRARFTEIFVDEAVCVESLSEFCGQYAPSVSPPKPRPLQAHDLKSKVFVVPTWCDICKGVLVGHGFVCAGPCQMRCHRGLGANGAENCKAELLMKKCEEVAHVQGQYQFGDVTKQIFRNEKQRIKDLVVTEFVKEQASFGKFDKLKAYSEALQEWWDEDRVVRYMLFAIFSIELVLFVISYSSVFLCAWPVHGASRAGRLAWLQAVSNCTSAAVFEGLLILLIHVLATQLLVYSDLVHSFVREILQINLSELQIDVGKAADAVTNITIHGLKTTACVACLGMALWMRAVQLVYDYMISAS